MTGSRGTPHATVPPPGAGLPHEDGRGAARTPPARAALRSARTGGRDTDRAAPGGEGRRALRHRRPRSPAHTRSTLRRAVRAQRPTGPPGTGRTASRPPARAVPVPGTAPRPGRTLVRARFRLAGPDGLPGVTVDAVPGPGGTRAPGHAGAVTTRALAEAGLGHLGGHLRLRVYGRTPAAADTARAVRRAVRRAVTVRPRPAASAPRP